MAYDPAAPDDATDIDVAAGELRANFAALKTHLESDHSALGSANAGRHTVLNMEEQGSDPSNIASIGQLFTDSNGDLKFISGDGETTQITLAGMLSPAAWVKFDTTGAVGAGGSHNVTSVTKNPGSGSYTVNFTNNFADTNYIPLAIANASAGSTDARHVQVVTQLAASVKIQVRDNSSAKDANVWLACFGALA